MITTWELNDIVCGRIVCRNDKSYLAPNSMANVTYKIGYSPTGPSENKFRLISLADGLVIHIGNGTREELISFLNKENFRFITHKELVSIINKMRDWY